MQEPVAKLGRLERVELRKAWASESSGFTPWLTSIPESANLGNSYTATYDAWNRLVQLVDASSGHTVQQNQYDARNFRAVILSYTGGTLSETRHCYYTSSWQEVEERVGTSTTADRQFVWGVRYIDDLVLRDTASGRLYALQDANWNVTSIANASGTVQERYAYSPYGAPNFLNASFGTLSTSGYGREALYCGYRFDSDSGLYLVRNRSYQSSLGVWCQRDPVGYTDGFNFFEYARSMPIDLIDPFGLFGPGNGLYLPGITPGPPNNNYLNTSPIPNSGALKSSIDNSIAAMQAFYAGLFSQYWYGDQGAANQFYQQSYTQGPLGQSEQIGPGTYNATALALGVATAAMAAAVSLMAFEAAGGETMQIACRKQHFAWNTARQGWQHATGQYRGYMSAMDFPAATRLKFGEGFLRAVKGLPIMNSANATFSGETYNCFTGACTAWSNAGGVFLGFNISVFSTAIGTQTYNSLQQPPSTPESKLPQSPF